MVRFGVQPKMAPNRTEPNLTITMDEIGLHEKSLEHSIVLTALSVFLAEM